MALNIDKLNLVGHIHTLQIESNDFESINVPDYLRIFFPNGKYGTFINQNTGEPIFRAALNPNKPSGSDNTEYNYCKNYQEMKENCFYILEQIGIRDPSKVLIRRADFAIDSPEDNYDNLYRLNKMLILLISSCYKNESETENVYESNHPLTLRKLTIRLHNDRFEVENYNKKLQSNDKDFMKNRLEFRRFKDLNSSFEELPSKIVTHWKTVFKKCKKEKYDNLQSELNSSLKERWIAENWTNGNISRFLKQYDSNFFTHQQITAFYRHRRW